MDWNDFRVCNKPDTSNSALGLVVEGSTQGGSKPPTGQQLWDEAKKWLEEKSHGSQDAHSHKNPEEDSINHHGNVLPVILHLWGHKKKR